MSLFDMPPMVSKHGAKEVTSNKKLRIAGVQSVLAEVFGTIEHGTDYHYVTGGSWSLHDQLRYCLRQTGPADVLAFTWSITPPAVDILFKLKAEGLLRSISFVIDGQMSKWARDAYAQLGHLADTIRIARNHAKGFVLQNDDWKIAVVSSANFSNNPRIEAGILSTVPEVYDFHRCWVEKMIANGDPFAPSDEPFAAAIPFEPGEVPDKALFIIRGLPGAGKSTLAALIADVVFENDDYFTINGRYLFAQHEHLHAVATCFTRTKDAMAEGIAKIAVANTFTSVDMIKPYADAAKHFGYAMFQIVIENTHGSDNIHAVPADSIKAMKKRFQIRLGEVD